MTTATANLTPAQIQVRDHLATKLADPATRAALFTSGKPDDLRTAHPYAADLIDDAQREYETTLSKSRKRKSPEPQADIAGLDSMLGDSTVTAKPAKAKPDPVITSRVHRIPATTPDDSDSRRKIVRGNLKGRASVLPVAVETLHDGKLHARFFLSDGQFCAVERAIASGSTHRKPADS